MTALASCGACDGRASDGQQLYGLFRALDGGIFLLVLKVRALKHFHQYLWCIGNFDRLLKYISDLLCSIWK